jgi:hypothetical protein
MPDQYYSRIGMWRSEEAAHREKEGDGGNCTYPYIQRRQNLIHPMVQIKRVILDTSDL